MRFHSRFVRTLILAAALVTPLAAPAYAGAASIARLTLKAGSFGFTTASPSSKIQFAGGLDYIVSKPLPIAPVLVSAYIDLIGQSTGFGFAVRNSGPLYAGVGAGYYDVSTRFIGGCAAGGPGLGSGCPPPPGTASGLGGKAFVGALVANHFQIEGAYNTMPQVEGYSTNAVSVTLGVRL